MRLLDMPAWFADYGLDVVETDGWERRGSPLPMTPKVVIGHHTAGLASGSSDLPTFSILRDGRDGPNPLPGPLCQVGLGRSGRVYLIASGKANHAGRGRWGDVTDSRLTVGIEVEHPGRGPWTDRQLDAFDRCAAALLDGLGLTAADYCGHREWALPAGRKPDPAGVDLDAQRRRIHHHLTSAQTGDDMTPEQARQLDEVHDMLLALVAPRRTDKADRDSQRLDLGDLFTRLERVEGKVDELRARP